MPEHNTLTNEQAMVAEARSHYHKLLLMADPRFHDGNRVGLAQLDAGQTVSYEMLRRKYGRH